MGGESHGNGNANATSRRVHPPATAPVAAANGGSGNGNAGKGGGGGSFGEKLKFSVFERGCLWSTVRRDNESLEEFAAAIMRDARPLAFSHNHNFIERLQREHSDDSEPEVVKVYVLLEDIKLWDNEQLLNFIVKHTQPFPPPRIPRNRTPQQSPESQSTPQVTNAIASNCNVSARVAAPSSSPDLVGPRWVFPSANVQNSLAPQSGDDEGVDNEKPNGGSQLVVSVHRRSKTRPRGVGTHYLSLSDVYAHFHLRLVNAAEKLGVSQTTLKTACRKFGLKRWPGRKVRSKQKTRQEVLHALLDGQGAGLEELTEAYMRSEVCKLQQEMDQLVHGTPAQHSLAVRTADLYKRLHSPGERSKYHSTGCRDMLSLDNGNPTKPASGLALPTTRRYRRAVEVNQQHEGP